jgi:hypothetical protein
VLDLFWVKAILWYGANLPVMTLMYAQGIVYAPYIELPTVFQMEVAICQM